MATSVKNSEPGQPLFTPELMAELDTVIRGIPEVQLRSIDHHMPGLSPEVSIDPAGAFGKIREIFGDVVEYADGKFGDFEVYNGFGHDLSRPNFAVLGYSAIKEMVMDQEHFINGGAYGDQAKAQSGGIVTVNELDGAEHREMRKLFDIEVLSRQYLVDFSENTIGPAADFLARRIADKFDRGEHAELCRDFALPLLYISMSRIVGIGMADLSYFVELSERVFGGPRDFEGAQRATVELTEYFTRVYSQRQAKGDLNGGDLMSVMSTAERAGRRFNAEEVVLYSRFLLPAGIETTWRQVANICYAFMAHPAQYDELVANSALRPAAIEEVLRWLSSGSVLPRICRKDTVLAGVDIPAGASLLGVFSAANHDPRIWPDGDTFNIHRDRKPHLTFSAGVHACMGQQLARQSFTHAVRAMAEFLPDMALACDPGEMRATGYIIRCPDKVPVKRRQA